MKNHRGSNVFVQMLQISQHATQAPERWQGQWCVTDDPRTVTALKRRNLSCAQSQEVEK